MGVKKIFITLVTIVACVILGAFVLNTLMPNVTTTIINSAEDMIFKATKMSFDFNNDGNVGDSGGTYSGENSDKTVTGKTDGNVEGFS